MVTSVSSNCKREEAQPIFYLHTPDKLQATEKLSYWYNQNLFTTPFDAYKIILDGSCRTSGMVDGK